MNYLVSIIMAIEMLNIDKFRDSLDEVSLKNIDTMVSDMERIESEITRLGDSFNNKFGISLEQKQSLSQIEILLILERSYRRKIVEHQQRQIEELQKTIISYKTKSINKTKKDSKQQIEISDIVEQQIRPTKRKRPTRTDKELKNLILEEVEKHEKGLYQTQITKTLKIDNRKIKPLIRQLVSSNRLEKKKNNELNKLVKWVYLAAHRDEDLGTVVVIDLPNIINSYRNEKENIYRRKYKKEPPMRITPDKYTYEEFKELFIYHVKEYNKIIRCQIFSTPTYNYINKYINKLATETPKYNIILYIKREKNKKTRKWEDIDPEMDKYLDQIYKLNKDELKFSHLVSFGGDHIYVPSLLNIGSLGVSISVIAHKECLSGEYDRLSTLNTKKGINYSSHLFNNSEKNLAHA